MTSERILLRIEYGEECVHGIQIPDNPKNRVEHPGGGRNKQISENEEEIKVFYCLAQKTRMK